MDLGRRRNGGHTAMRDEEVNGNRRERQRKRVEKRTLGWW